MLAQPDYAPDPTEIFIDMNKLTPETVSDLMDRRLSGERTDMPMDGVANDPALTRNWRNFHLIGEVIRGDVQETGKDRRKSWRASRAWQIWRPAMDPD